MKALRDTGASEYTLGDEQSLEIVHADLYNLHEKLFDGVDGIIGFTSTCIGSLSDRLDRAMLFQKKRNVGLQRLFCSTRTVDSHLPLDLSAYNCVELRGVAMGAVSS